MARREPEPDQGGPDLAEAKDRDDERLDGVRRGSPSLLLTTTERFAAEVVPAVREIVGRERAARGAAA